MANLKNFLQDNIKTNTTSKLSTFAGEIGEAKWEIVEPLHIKFTAKAKLIIDLDITLEIIMKSEQANGNDCTYIRTVNGNTARLENVRYESSNELKLYPKDTVSPVSYYKEGHNDKVTVFNGRFWGLWHHVYAVPQNTTLSQDETLEVYKAVAENIEA